MTSSPLAEESTALGNKLHDMINSKINTNTLALSASTENNSLKIKIKNNDGVESVELSMKSDITSSISDHPVDIFEDKNIITAVACISNENHKNKLEKERNTNMIKHEVQEFGSCNEVQKLENALYRQLSKGVFQKRLRMKNLTLTPKQSLQHMLVLQSNDAKSLIVKSTLSQNLDVSMTDKISKLNILPVISRKAVNFNLPLQIATVGYVLPTYHALSNNNKKNSLDNKNMDNNFHSITTKNNESVDKTVQCYKGHKEGQSLKQNMETKGTDMFTMNTVCTKALSEISNLTIDNQLRTASNEKIIAETRLRKNAYRSQNEMTIKSKNEIMKSSENISNSTSLDILVGLLNEIKKITTCQSDLVPSSNEAGNISESKEVKVFLNNATAPDRSASHSVKCSMSISSLDSKQKHPSIFSLHLQSNTENHINNFKSIKDNKTIENMTYIKPMLSDKEINVHISPNEYVNRCTDVPSRLFPITVNRGTNVVKSLIAFVNRNSSEPYSNCVNVLYSNSTFKKVSLLSRVNSNKISFASLKPDDKKIQEIVTKGNILQSIMITTGEKIKPVRNTGSEKNILNTNNFNTLQEFDYLLKMKRDILVTVYSILVFTVFAALTMPEIIFPM